MKCKLTLQGFKLVTASISYYTTNAYISYYIIFFSFYHSKQTKRRLPTYLIELYRWEKWILIYKQGHTGSFLAFFFLNRKIVFYADHFTVLHWIKTCYTFNTSWKIWIRIIIIIITYFVSNRFVFNVRVFLSKTTKKSTECMLKITMVKKQKICL